MKLLLVILPLQLPVHEAPEVLKEISEGKLMISRKEVG